MRILVCPDKFKGSLTAREVIDAITVGIRRVHPTAKVVGQPMADGGEGSLKIIRQLHPLKEHRLEVTGPLRRPVQAGYLMGEGTAYIETAKACGLQHVPPRRRNPGYATTIGVGQLIEDAVARGAQRVNLFLGGSATNDAGVGMAAALGYRFISDKGHDFVPSGDSLAYVADIDYSGVSQRILDVPVSVIHDVRNPLLGANGATRVYAPQKGAGPEQVENLERQMHAFVSQIDRCLAGATWMTSTQSGFWMSNLRGAGAAGGLAFGASVFLKSILVEGATWLADEVGLEAGMANTDLVITGEGKIDGQTTEGKVVAGVGRLASLKGIPALAVCGVNELQAGDHLAGIGAIRALMDLPGVTEEISFKLTAELLARAVEDYLQSSTADG